MEPRLIVWEVQFNPFAIVSPNHLNLLGLLAIELLILEFDMLLKLLVLVLVLVLEGQRTQQIVDLSEIYKHYSAQYQVEERQLKNEETYVGIAQKD